MNDRLKKAPKRIEALVERYPVVAGAMFLAGMLTGILLGWLL